MVSCILEWVRPAPVLLFRVLPMSQDGRYETGRAGTDPRSSMWHWPWRPSWEKSVSANACENKPPSTMAAPRKKSAASSQSAVLLGSKGIGKQSLQHACYRKKPCLTYDTGRTWCSKCRQQSQHDRYVLQLQPQTSI